MADKRLLEVGDRVLIENTFLRRVVTITRVTKTKAVAKVNRKDGTSFDYTFQRETNGNWVYPKPYINFDTTKRTLLTINK